MRFVVFLWISAALLAGCSSQASGPDFAKMSAQEQRGYRLYMGHCIMCHEAYSSSDRNGPSLQGMYKKPYLPSGMPANEDRVRDAILLGRAKMPAYKGLLTPQQLDDLLAYMRTL